MFEKSAPAVALALVTESRTLALGGVGPLSETVKTAGEPSVTLMSLTAVM
jgi:hypothetical protein